ncbi:hypothetical protein [Asticcacaulis sp. AC460]|uniref:hypothetical protein n=1 Tax=Asticcacaulis sp. AC460 TaxID=1282360 RepID=UPI0003F7E0A9|nr:hypothetical protein [Asticcacaulis sp. AC460]
MPVRNFGPTEGLDAEDAAKLDALRAAVQKGIDSIERGEYTEFKDAASLRAHLAAIADKVLKGEA